MSWFAKLFKGEPAKGEGTPSPRASKPAAEAKPSTAEELKAANRAKREKEERERELRDENGLPRSSQGPVLMEAEPDEANVRRASEIEVEEWEADNAAEQEILTMIFGENLDLTLLSFLSLDENDREALLQ